MIQNGLTPGLFLTNSVFLKFMYFNSKRVNNKVTNKGLDQALTFSGSTSQFKEGSTDRYIDMNIEKIYIS